LNSENGKEIHHNISHDSQKEKEQQKKEAAISKIP